MSTTSPASSLLLATALAAAACRGEPRTSPPAQTDTTPQETAMTITISSPAFVPNGSIPAKYTCDGGDTSPPLSWSGLPDGTRSLALIVDDPDAPDPRAPKRTWVHWVLYDIPPTTTGLPEGAARGQLPAGTRQGVNDWGRPGYGGPCPPIGRHRYFHKVFALDTLLSGVDRPTKAQLEQAMSGHVLGQGELVGTYQRGK